MQKRIGYVMLSVTQYGMTETREVDVYDVAGLDTELARAGFDPEKAGGMGYGCEPARRIVGWTGPVINLPDYKGGRSDYPLLRADQFFSDPSVS